MNEIQSQGIAGNSMKQNSLIKEILDYAMNFTKFEQFTDFVQKALEQKAGWDMVRIVEFDLSKGFFVSKEFNGKNGDITINDFYSADSYIINQIKQAEGLFHRKIEQGIELEKYERKLLSEGFKHIFLLPIRVRDKFVGVLACFSKEDEKAVPDRLAYLETVNQALALSQELFFNIRQKDKINEKLQEYLDNLIQTETGKILVDLIPGAANELNNILTRILGYSELIERKENDPELKKLISEVKKSALIGKDTIKSLQEFKNLDLKGDLTLIDVNELITKAVQLTKPKWRDEAWAKNIEYKVEMDLRKTDPIMGNSSTLLEAMISLVFKALEGIPMGGRLTLQTLQDDEYITIFLKAMGESDNTSGFAVYDLFFPAREVSTGSSNLRTAQEIIRRHRGTTMIENKVGHGVLITVKIPISVGTDVNKPSSIISEKKTSTILVVEDDEVVRSLLSNALKIEGFSVSAAEDGYQAIEKMKDQIFDLMLTDLGMPGMSGYQLAVEAKKMRPKMPIILATGWESRIDRQKMEEYKIDYVVGKPFLFEDIFDAINKCLSKSD